MYFSEIHIENNYMNKVMHYFTEIHQYFCQQCITATEKSITKKWLWSGLTTCNSQKQWLLHSGKFSRVYAIFTSGQASNNLLSDFHGDVPKLLHPHWEIICDRRVTYNGGYDPWLLHPQENLVCCCRRRYILDEKSGELLRSIWSIEQSQQPCPYQSLVHKSWELVCILILWV